MKDLIIFLLFALIPSFVSAQKTAVNTNSGTSDCAICTKKDKKGHCKEWDFSNCEPTVIIAKYKGYTDITKSQSDQKKLEKVIFADSKIGKINKDWGISGRNGGVIILVNKRKNTTAGVSCKGCCSIVVENNTVRCAKGAGCTDCGMIVVSPLPKKI